MSERIDRRKFFSGFRQPVRYIKDGAIGLRLFMMIGFVAFLGLTIYKAYFVKDVEQTQKIEKIEVIAEEGSKVTVGQTGLEGQDDKWFDAYSGLGVRGYTSGEFEAFVEVGIRFWGGNFHA